LTLFIEDCTIRLRRPWWFMRARWIGIGVVVAFLGMLGAACSGSRSSDTPDSVTAVVILSDLRNPRGVALDTEGGLVVAEAGLGDDARDVTDRTGRLTRFVDRDGNGFFGDPGEAEPWFEHLASYNAMDVYATGRDEVSGPSDVALHTDGRLYLTVDGGFEEFALFEISSGGSMGRNLASRSNMTGIVLSRDERSLFVTESTLNQLIEITLDTGARREITIFSSLDSGQQAVPAGLALDPRDGSILVALFSGVAQAADGSFIPFVAGDAKVVRVDPSTGGVSDEITGLTTAVDVVVDALGNIYVVEMASDYADLLDHGADLFDPDADPLHGGYVRYSGQVTMFPGDGSQPVVLVRGLDAPTNITLDSDGELYVSTGQGTPGRPIPGPDGSVVIIGEVVRIAGF
jgi:sugar lactone lactonase YvrE